MDRGTEVSYHVERVRAGKTYLEAELVLLNVLIRGTTTGSAPFPLLGNCGSGILHY